MCICYINLSEFIRLILLNFKKFYFYLQMTMHSLFIKGTYNKYKLKQKYLKSQGYAKIKNKLYTKSYLKKMITLTLDKLATKVKF